MPHRLIEGAVEFKRKDFEEHRALFVSLEKQQRPHTLFIGCSDSRVMPNMITGTLPGELFTVRNVANIVPPYRATGEYVATTSAIEYALLVLNVENIVVCGHSNCGGCGALFLPEDRLKGIPHVRKWLELAGNVKQKIVKDWPDCGPDERAWLAEQINVVEQLKHLLTYPFIQERYDGGGLKLFGWHYIIETGEVYNYDFNTRAFEMINGG